jgi:hypothetical protein
MLYPLHKDSAPNTPTSIMLRSGRYLDLFNPRPEDIELDDVAAGLEQPRFKNQTTVPITIADHLLRCGRLALALGLPLDIVIACMMHDVGEFALGDPPGPIKKFMRFWVDGELLPFEVIEDRHLAAVVRSVIPHEELAGRVIDICTGVDTVGHSDLKAIDEAALYVEALTWIPGAENWAPASAVPPGFWAAMLAPPDSLDWTEIVSRLRGAAMLVAEAGGERPLLGQLRYDLLGRHDVVYPRPTI